jgi:integrase
VRRSTYKGQVTDPKTHAGIRKVDLPHFVLEDLRLFQMMTAGQPGDRLFRSAAGRALNPDYWSERVLKPILEAAGLPSSFGLHGLRHTYASLLINQGENIKFIGDVPIAVEFDDRVAAAPW